MKFLKLISRKEKVKKAIKLSDFYQNSIEKAGRAQFQMLVDKGLNVSGITL